MNVKKSLVKTIAVFTVMMLALAFCGRIMSVMSTDDSTPPTVDLSGAYGAAKSDFPSVWADFLLKTQGARAVKNVTVCILLILYLKLILYALL